MVSERNIQHSRHKFSMSINMVSDRNIQHNWYKFSMEHQYGFRQKHSTQLATITLFDRIPWTKVSLLSRYFWIKKEFDTVDHPTMLRK